MSLKILQPRIEFTEPKIRYFVSIGSLEKKTSLSISHAQGSDENTIMVKENELLLLPDKEYFISATISNISKKNILSVLVQVYLDDRIIDEIAVHNLTPEDQKVFETAILNDAKPEKKLSFRVFDKSEKGKIIGLKEITVITIRKSLVS